MIFFSRLRKNVPHRKADGGVVSDMVPYIVPSCSEISIPESVNATPAKTLVKPKITLSVVLFIRNMKASYLAHACAYGGVLQ
jgi:hypothetical protein